MISVIVPVYNSEPYLARCLDSLLAQTNVGLEIIIVDDCSTDSSRAICENYHSAWPSILRLICNEKNEGQVRSYLRALELAKGEFIAFVDSDDWVVPDFLSKLYGLLVSSEADIAACSCWQVRGSAREAELSASVPRGSKALLNGRDIAEAMAELNTRGNLIFDTVGLYRWNKLYRRDLVMANLGYADAQVRMFEDNNLVVPCLLDSERVVFLNEPLYYYNRHMGTTTGSYDSSILDSNRRYLEVQRRVFADRSLPHPLKFDAINADSFVISKAIACNAGRADLLDAISAFRRHALDLGIGDDDIARARVSDNFALLLKQARRGHLGRALLLGRIYYLTKRIRLFRDGKKTPAALGDSPDLPN